MLFLSRFFLLSFPILFQNPLFHFDEVAFVNDPSVIRLNPGQVAINACLEVDLTGLSFISFHQSSVSPRHFFRLRCLCFLSTGQICSDSIGTRLFSGFGGQVDFVRGAALSEGGLPIIALPSITSRGQSRIMPMLKTGAGVVTTRAHAHYVSEGHGGGSLFLSFLSFRYFLLFYAQVATEWGIVFLWGKSNRERAKLLISIAHPNHREMLEKAAFERHALLLCCHTCDFPTFIPVCLCRFGPLVWPVETNL